jgi:hypothetical protein
VVAAGRCNSTRAGASCAASSSGRTTNMNPNALTWCVAAGVTLCLLAQANAQDWKPAEGRLMTRWAKDVNPDNVLPEYPRPQMVRKEWQNLNGLWDYAIRPKGEGKPDKWDGKILVPFAAESALSGVMKSVGPDNRLWYRRTFSVPEKWSGQRVLLHFGAVDWETTVWVNGKEAGSHRGGFDPFSFDLTELLNETGEQEVVVAVWDPTDAGMQPRGKQVAKPGGIFYTAVTGIWQTVWLEPVSDAHIESLKIVPNLDMGKVEVMASLSTNEPGDVVRFGVLQGDREIAFGFGAPGPMRTISIPNPEQWSPDSPVLYGLRVQILRDWREQERGEGVDVLGDPIDEVTGYFAMRKIELADDDKGVRRIFLNGKPLFQYGPLDQGWWPDGLYTAPTDEALKYDIEITKKLGFNMIRKHVKVEPARWYHHCDKLGMLVWQDMPNGDQQAKWDPNGTHDGTEITRTPESAKQYEVELKAMIDALHNHPSIVMWVPFNEAWGQFDTVRVTNWIKEYDPTRLVNPASGGNDFPVGDVKDLHMYPGPGAPKPDGKRAIVLGEFGGLGLPVEGHTWQSKDNWGYVTYKDAGELATAYENLMVRLRRLIDAPGLSAAVYTQTTDVEGEVNGLLTYDRAVLKIPEDRLRAVHAALWHPAPQVKTLAVDARAEGSEWRYTTAKPADGWEKPAFKDGAWKAGTSGFGTEGTPGTAVRTTWDTPEIWLRRTFELPAGGAAPVNPHLAIHHDEDAEVYLNGVLAARVRGYTTDYVEVPIAPEARATLKPGKNVIAIHCKQTGGGQYIDAGVVDLVPAGKPE